MTFSNFVTNFMGTKTVDMEAKKGATLTVKGKYGDEKGH